MLNGIQNIQQLPTYRPMSHSPVSLTLTCCRVINRDHSIKHGTKRPWNDMLLSRHFPEGTAKNRETSQGSRCAVRDPNQALAAYKTKGTA